MAGPVLSVVTAITPYPAAPATEHVVPAKWHGPRPRSSCFATSCPPSPCCRCRLRLLLFRRRQWGWPRQLLLLLLLLLLRGCPGALVV